MSSCVLTRLLALDSARSLPLCRSTSRRILSGSFSCLLIDPAPPTSFPILKDMRCYRSQASHCQLGSVRPSLLFPSTASPARGVSSDCVRGSSWVPSVQRCASFIHLLIYIYILFCCLLTKKKKKKNSQGFQNLCVCVCVFTIFYFSY